MPVLNHTINPSKNPELLSNVQLKITALQIALFLHIPINDTFLQEMWRL